jgi:hypothetical protein
MTKPSSTESPAAQQKKDRVRTWLSQLGWQVVYSQAEGAAWILESATARGVALGVIQPNAFPDQLIIQGSVQVGDGRRMAFEAASSEERQKLIWDLRFGLLSLGVESKGIDEPLETIMFRRTVYDDGLNKDVFMDRAFQIHRATLFVVWTFQRHFSEPPGGASDQSLFVH